MPLLLSFLESWAVLVKRHRILGNLKLFGGWGILWLLGQIDKEVEEKLNYCPLQRGVKWWPWPDR